MQVLKLSTKESYPLYKKLYKETLHDNESYAGADYFNLKLFRGDFKILKNRFNLQTFALIDQNKNTKVLCTYYQAINKDLGTDHSLGAFLVTSDIKDEEIKFFSEWLKNEFKDCQDKIYAPLNGHMSLGVSIPDLNTDPKLISFLTTAKNKYVYKLLNGLEMFNQKRKLHALSAKGNSSPEYITKLEDKIKQCPENISTRTLSTINFKRDMKIYNYLVNNCFQEHFEYYPLSFEEDWEMMKLSLPLMKKNYFRFILIDGKEVGLSWFMPDYNEGFKNGQDIRNMFRINSIKKNHKRVRGIYVAILPEYQGKGLIKYARIENYLEIMNNEVESIEASYIDEENINSISTVKSTGGQESHQFLLYSKN